MKKNILEIVSTLFVALFIILTIFDGNIGRQGAIKGILICGNVIIPSVFSFTFFSVFLTKGGLINYLSKLDKITGLLVKLTGYEFFIFLISLIGGYPCGIKLLNNSVKENKIDREKAQNMSYFCVSAGPAFSVTVIGIGFLNNKELGYCLFASQILTAIVILVFTRPFRSFYKSEGDKAEVLTVSENFITSAYDASTTTINICSFVILFSFIIAYVEIFSKYFKPINVLKYILEVTNAASKTTNVYLISFLLGFSGISIILQILSLGKDIKIKVSKFIAIRILAGLLNLLFLKLILLIFPVFLETSYQIKPTFLNIESQPLITLSLILTVLVFLISISSKKSVGNLKGDVV